MGISSRLLTRPAVVASVVAAVCACLLASTLVGRQVPLQEASSVPAGSVPASSTSNAKKLPSDMFTSSLNLSSQVAQQPHSDPIGGANPSGGVGSPSQA